jgi:hypothetical protein
MALRNRETGKKKPAEPKGESPAVQRARNIAGVASLLGIVALTAFAFERLTPWWKETVEDYLEEHPGEDREL